MANYTLHTLAQAPAMIAGFDRLAQQWVPFMNHDTVAGELFGYLYEWFAEYQLGLLDENDTVIARMLAAPIRWDGHDESLPDRGWDWVLTNAVETYRAGLTPNAVSAIEINVTSDLRGQGLSRVGLGHMKANARRLGFGRLVAPVRPNMKSHYPLTPMENYIHWQHDDSGAPFDPWLRVHWRDGARIAKVAPQSMVIPGTVTEWEAWTGMRFPESGTYVVPGALVPVEIDRENDRGTYTEPNVWIVHTL